MKKSLLLCLAVAVLSTIAAPPAEAVVALPDCAACSLEYDFCRNQCSVYEPWCIGACINSYLNCLRGCSGGGEALAVVAATPGALCAASEVPSAVAR